MKTHKIPEERAEDTEGQSTCWVLQAPAEEAAEAMEAIGYWLLWQTPDRKQVKERGSQGDKSIAVGRCGGGEVTWHPQLAEMNAHCLVHLLKFIQFGIPVYQVVTHT